MTLANGDRVTVEICKASPDAAVLRLFGSERWRIPMTAVANISLRPDERQLLAWNPADDSLSLQNSPRRWEIPAHGGDLTCRFGGESAEANQLPQFAWVADFADGGRITIAADAAGRWHAEPSPSSPTAVLQTAAAVNRQQAEFRLQTVADRIYVSLNGRLLLSDVRPAGALQSLEWTPANAAESEDQGEPRDLAAYVLVVARQSSSVELPKPRSDVDAIVSADGDVWWGDFQALSPKTVSWAADERIWNHDLAAVSSVVFRATKPAPIGRSLTGHVVRVELQPLADRLDLPGDRLTGALHGASDGLLHLEHLLGGRLAIPLDAVRRIESVHFGEYRVLATGETVDGPSAQCAGTFQLFRVPEEAVTLSVEVGGLEPSGPQTPPGSARLKSLRQGKGATEVYVNKRRIGVLNEFTSRWTMPGEFKTLRVTVPREWLIPGKNAWSIRPAETTGNPPDQPRFRTIALELPAEMPQNMLDLLR